MDAKKLLKLSELKTQEIDYLRNDFSTLENIVIGLEGELKSQVSFIQDFLEGYTNNRDFGNNSISILDGRLFLQDLNLKKKTLEERKSEAELQKLAAYESLKNAITELRKLSKLILKQQVLDSKARIAADLLIADTLEIHRYNRESLTI